METPNSRRSVFSGLFWVYSETIAAQLVTFIVTIILARLLSPNDYGTIALVTVFVNVANVFVNNSFSYALIQKKDVDELDYNTMFWFNLSISAFLYILLFFGAPYISRYYDIAILCPVLRVLAIKVPVSAYNSIQLAKVAKELKFKKSFISTSGSTFVSGIIGIILAYKGYGIWALAVQVISNAVLNTIFLMAIVEWHPRIQFSWGRLQPLFQFGWKILATGLMFTGFSEFVKLVIGKRYSTDELGYYEKGSQFPHFIASNVDTTINRVLFPTLSNQQDDRKRLVEVTRRSAKTGAYIMTPILFGLAITAPTIIHLLLTDKWLPCVPFVQLLSFSWWLQPTQSCSIQGIKAIGRSDVYLHVEIFAKVFAVIALILSILLFDSTLAIACSLLLAQIFAVIVYGYYAEKLLGYKIKEQVYDLFSCGVIGLIMMIVVYFVGLIDVNEIVLLCIQTIIGAVVYIVFSKLFRLEEFSYLLGLVKQSKSNKK